MLRCTIVGRDVHCAGAGAGTAYLGISKVNLTFQSGVEPTIGYLDGRRTLNNVTKNTCRITSGGGRLKVKGR